jgi:hypothetical protein
VIEFRARGLRDGACEISIVRAVVYMCESVDVYEEIKGLWLIYTLRLHVITFTLM